MFGSALASLTSTSIFLPQSVLSQARISPDFHAGLGGDDFDGGAASSRAFLGWVSSTSSTPSVARMAMRLPVRGPYLVSGLSVLKMLMMVIPWLRGVAVWLINQIRARRECVVRVRLGPDCEGFGGLLSTHHGTTGLNGAGGSGSRSEGWRCVVLRVRWLGTAGPSTRCASVGMTVFWVVVPFEKQVLRCAKDDKREGTVLAYGLKKQIPPLRCGMTTKKAVWGAKAWSS
jgi:hypothetical protein